MVEPELELETVFKEKLSPQVHEMGKLATWALPEITEGTYPVARIDVLPDTQVIQFLEFNQASQTFTFNG